MRTPKRKVRIGILGCGAIGSRIAESIKSECPRDAFVSGVYDIDFAKSEKLALKFPRQKIVKQSYKELLKASDLVVEAVNAKQTHDLVRLALTAEKDILTMSVGKLLGANDLFRLARKNRCRLLIPSGAIAGVDAIKGARLAGIEHITLTTRKPLKGFINNSYIIENNINLDEIKKETVLFDGNVAGAVKAFPQNINVAATIALASEAADKMRIRILTSPDIDMNSHEIEVIGASGRILTRTENEICPDNPKTSYLAVLSAISTLKQYFQVIQIGT